MENLPNEVLEVILYNLDGQSLARASQVCWKWYKVVKSLEKMKSVWRKVCIQDIPHCILEQLLGNRLIPSDPAAADWKRLYDSWFRGRMVGSWIHNKKSIKDIDNPVTCIKISGSYILTGHRNGNIIAWSENTFSHVVNRHLNMVNDLALYDVIHLGCYIPNKRFWDHTHILSVSKDFTLHVSFLLIEDIDRDMMDLDMYSVAQHSSALEVVRIFNETVVVGASDNTILIYTMVMNPIKVYRIVLHRTRIISCVQPVIRYLGFWDDKIRFWSSDCSQKIFSLTADHLREIEQIVSYKRLIPKHIPMGRFLMSAMLFYKTVVFLFTVDGRMLISVDSEHFVQHSLMTTVHSIVMSIAMRGSILALGTESGHLLLYTVPDIKQLWALKLDQPAWRGDLSPATIISIDISDDGESPLVVAATTETIFIIKWQHRQNFRVLRSTTVRAT